MRGYHFGDTTPVAFVLLLIDRGPRLQHRKNGRHNHG